MFGVPVFDGGEGDGFRAVAGIIVVPYLHQVVDDRRLTPLVEADVIVEAAGGRRHTDR